MANGHHGNPGRALSVSGTPYLPRSTLSYIHSITDGEGGQVGNEWNKIITRSTVPLHGGPAKALHDFTRVDLNYTPRNLISLTFDVSVDRTIWPLSMYRFRNGMSTNDQVCIQLQLCYPGIFEGYDRQHVLLDVSII